MGKNRAVCGSGITDAPRASKTTQLAEERRTHRLPEDGRCAGPGQGLANRVQIRVAGNIVEPEEVPPRKIERFFDEAIRGPLISLLQEKGASRGVAPIRPPG